MTELMKASKNPIYEVEISPFLLAATCGHIIQGVPVVGYVDNRATRSAYIMAYAATSVADAFVGAFVKGWNAVSTEIMMARVPSASNRQMLPVGLMIQN